jgi:hypothetical protein
MPQYYSGVSDRVCGTSLWAAVTATATADITGGAGPANTGTNGQPASPTKPGGCVSLSAPMFGCVLATMAGLVAVMY